MKIILGLLLIFIYIFPSHEIRELIVNILSYIWIFSIPFFIVYIYYKKDKEHEVKLDNIFTKIPVLRTPVELGYLLKGKIVRSHLTATLMSLISKNVLKVKKNSNSYIFIYNKDHEEKLSQSESFLIHWFINRIGDKHQCSTEAIISESKTNSNFFYKSYKEWVDNATFEAIKQNFFEGTRFIIDGSLSYTAIAIILTLINILKVGNFGLIYLMVFLIIGLLIYIFTINRRTLEGNLEYRRWFSFRDNINLDEDDHSVEYLENCALYFQVFGRIDFYRKILNERVNKDSQVISNSNLLSLIENGDMIKINKVVEDRIKWGILKAVIF